MFAVPRCWWRMGVPALVVGVQVRPLAGERSFCCVAAGWRPVIGTGGRQPRPWARGPVAGVGCGRRGSLAIPRA